MARFDRVVPPGGSGKIVLSLDAAKVHGGFTKTATVQSNDSARPSLRITLKGIVRHYVDLVPERLFLRGFKEDAPRGVVKITSNLPEPLEIKEISSPELAPRLDWEMKTLQEGKEYQLEVVNKAGVGRYNGRIVLTTSSPQKPRIDIPVFMDISGDIGYFPNSLELGRVSPGSTDQPQPLQPGRAITLWKNRGDGFKLGKVTYDKTRFEVEVQEQGPRYMVFVRPRLDKMKPGEFRGEVRIETTSTDLPEVVVPVHGWVQ